MVKDETLNSSKKKIIQKGGNILFSFLIFAIIFDPTNTILHLKDVFFIFLFAYNLLFFKPNLTYLVHIGIIFSVVLLCAIFAEIQQNIFSYEGLFAVLKSFAPLTLLLWIHRYDVIKLSVIPVFITSLITVILYIICTINPIIEEAMWTYTKAHEYTIMMSHRAILGRPIFAMYYKSLIAFTFSLVFCIYMATTVEKKKLGRIFFSTAAIVISLAFLVSGSRTTMLLPFFILIVVLFREIQQRPRAKYLLYPCLALAFILFVVFILVLASETSEASNMVKYAHVHSFLTLFEENPLYLVIGQGPATSFYTEGFGKLTTTTEWSYLDLLRNYGIFSFLILSVVLAPLCTMFKHRNDKYTFLLIGGYIAYLLIAGTNPLLLSSTGMLMILSAYSYKHQLLRIKKESCN